MNEKKSKGLALALLLMGCSLTMTARTADSTFVMPLHSIYGEEGGPCWGISANWDARLKKDSPWGYQVGLGWAGQWDNMMGIHTHTMYYGLTTGMNYLIGKRKSRLELGLGNQLRLISSKLLVAYMGKESYISIKSENKTQVRDFLYMNVGYRYTSTHGFQFRCGVTPMINTTNGWTTSDNAYSKGDVFLIPYVSFGKAF
ncbi:hypothetical protein [Hallella mizrahii]|uniref:Outer membrane protein beta-barrel domain-containing protein n=1 Tax=Hallella mizrahii TaxID=2606637 RepID=A0A7K0KGI9_9BACT|nr:hypothetical protein [Hallella mizrahii]MST85022.1 hypothetical protein [Hallella mizrahii]